MILTLFIILSLSSLSQTIITNVFFQSGTNLFTNDDVQRDGIVIVTLDTNENTSICNFNFNEKSANVVCRTLGFPAQGLSIINSPFRFSGNVFLANFQCTGTEPSLASCVNSGRSIQGGPCASHTSDVHVYCLQQKVAPVVNPNPVVTTCNLVTSDFILTAKGSRVNSGLLQASLNGVFQYVCNDDYSFQPDYARIICNRLCINSSGPSFIMPFFNESLQNINTNTAVRLTCNSATCSISDPIQCFKKSFLIGLQCGEEPQILEQSPNVTCTTKNMTVTWNAGFVPTINPSLISLATNPTCATPTVDGTGALNLLIIFDKCSATIDGNLNNIIFSYVLTRSYATENLVTLPPKSLTVSCSFPKPDQNTEGFKLNPVTNSPINATLTLDRRLEFYRDISYVNQINPPGVVDSDKKLFIKVYVINPTKNISLGLSDCWATTSPSSTMFDPTNSVSLIGSSCPNRVYDVLISPFTRTEIRFSFTPFKISSSPIQQIYVACSTFICYLNRDGFCPSCGSRKKRNVDISNYDEYRVEGSLYIRRLKNKYSF